MKFGVHTSLTIVALLLSYHRKVVEHISLLKAKEDLSVKDENDMLDFLYTSQYQMGGVVAISLGGFCRKMKLHIKYA